jgi:hypothetical protein
MFIVMDDIGSLIWHFGKKLVVNSADDEHDGHGDGHHAASKPPAAPAIVHSPAAE